MESERGTRVLIDTPPELRLQLLAAKIDQVDAVFFTHDHADHIHGIDDIRAITVRRESPLPIYGPSDTLDRLKRRFAYVFDERMRPLPGTSKPEGHAHVAHDGEHIAVGDLRVEPLALPHGPVTVFAYRFGPLAYVTDAKSVPADAVARLRGVQLLVLNALFRTEHPTHLSLSQAVDVARAIGAPQTYLTHLTHQNFHADLSRELPPEIQPAYDGLQVTLTT